MLTSEDIMFLLELLQERDNTYVEPTEKFPYRITREGGMGYAKDPKIGRLQAKLSVMGQMAAGR